MLDNHEGMIEFISAFEKDEHYFAIVEHRSRKFQFGVSRAGYKAIRKAMQFRPFDTMPGPKYRCFYSGSYKTVGPEAYRMEVRVELLRDAAKEQIDIPKDLHANLLWFQRLANIEDAAYLEIQ